MTTLNQAAFITNKIQQLQTAILYSHSDCLVKFPSSIVQVKHVDETGCVWISLSKPIQYIHGVNSDFHTALNFYKKHSHFYLNAYGIAKIVTDPLTIKLLPEDLITDYQNGKLLLCVRILEANYYETTPQTQQNFLQKIRHTINGIFTGNNDFYYYNAKGEQENFA